MPIIREFIQKDKEQLFHLWDTLDLGGKERGDDIVVINNTIEKGGKLFVMIFEEELIGSAWVTDDGRRLFLHHMGIHKNFQGKGYSKMLMDEVMNFTREKKMQIKLEVHEMNKIAQKLYAKYGFKPLNNYTVVIKRRLYE